ncbi:terminase [Nocardia vaccinii]|uniref:terminase n=1 Tax=Nocardia vaccinii TaxID=1822 RepID=UPI0008369127|nr:terminase [Nocardia vaccinii]
MARSRSAALISTPEDDFAEIIAWYEEQLATTVPPLDLEWEPVKIGPTWQWDPATGWHLPEHTLGWRVLAWCGKWLRDKKGEPWQFTPEQTRFVLWYFAIDEHGDFLYHSAVLQRLKGWGKDPVAACLSMAACFAEVVFDHWDGDRPIGREEPDAWVQIVAVNQEQTKNTMKLFPSLVPAETRAHYGIQIGKLNVWGLGDTRQIEAVTSSPLAIEGGRPKLVIRAEIQNWNKSNGGHEMTGALEGNAAKAAVESPARILDICNAYRPGEDSVGERTREAYEATLGEDARAMDFGLLYDSLEAPPDAPLTIEAAPEVLKAIRGDSVWLDARPTGRIVKSIINPNNSVNESRRKWYNQVTATADAWVDPKWFEMCTAKPKPEIGPREPVVLFFDGSKSDDSTGVVGCRISDGYIFVIGVWERPAQVQVWTVNRDAVDHKVTKAMAEMNVVGLWGDPSDARDDETGERFWEDLLDDWARRWGDRLLLPAVKSGDSAHKVIWDMRAVRHQQAFVGESERAITDIREKTLTHDGNRKLIQHTRNARRRPNKHGVSLGKEHRESARKVDLTVCMVGARLMRRTYLASGIKEQSNQAMFIGKRRR